MEAGGETADFNRGEVGGMHENQSGLRVLLFCALSVNKFKKEEAKQMTSRYSSRPDQP